MSNNNRNKAWIMCGLGVIGCLTSLAMFPQWVWIPLPFALTGLAQAFEAI
jgi:CHASE2 domain-containing sensor protein